VLQYIAEEKVVSPLPAAVFDNVKMDRTDVRGRVHDQQVAPCISMIEPVAIADIRQPPDEFRY